MQQSELSELLARIALGLGTKAQGNAYILLRDREEPVLGARDLCAESLGVKQV